MTIYTRISGKLTANAEYVAMLANGWVYVTADRVRANYYNLIFRCHG